MADPLEVRVEDRKVEFERAGFELTARINGEHIRVDYYHRGENAGFLWFLGDPDDPYNIGRDLEGKVWIFGDIRGSINKKPAEPPPELAVSAQKLLDYLYRVLAVDAAVAEWTSLYGSKTDKEVIDDYAARFGLAKDSS